MTASELPLDAGVVAEAQRRTWRELPVSRLRDFGIVFSFMGMFVFLTVKSDVFFSTLNFGNLLNQSAAIALIATAGTLLLISGGFDLSVGATFALGGVVSATLVDSVGTPTAMLVGALAGLAVGIFNGVLTTVGRINPLVATLASAIIVRGVALVITDGLLVNVKEPSFKTLGRGKLLGLHYSVYIWVSFAVGMGFVLAYTRFGRYVYASGGNQEAARLSGIRVGLVRGITYALSGLSAGAAGVLVASRVATGQADTGTGLELAVVAAIVVGGTSIWGGEGAVWRTVLGVLLLAMIGNGFNLLQVDPTYQQILQGGIILTAVAVDAWARRA